MRDRIAALLNRAGADGAFSAGRTTSADDLHLEVTGLGRVRLPVSSAQAQQLCRLARPARYGQGERTLLDRRVRDTWEIPKSRVKIDQRRWNQTLEPMVDKLRADLGLPEGCRLKAELHSMLVYAAGQFFLPHQDSEKSDGMVATLAVTLPASVKGGALTVTHRGEKATYRASAKELSFVGFYADCHHEVRPAKEGFRIVLTYNLRLRKRNESAAGNLVADPDAVAELADCLREHFATPPPPPSYAPKHAPPREPPSRLVYLLDHQYTEASFGWNRLKGDDAARVALLRAASERAGCESVLALAEVHESWSCYEPGWDDPWYGRHRRWTRDDLGDEWSGYEDPTADPDAYHLEELIDWNITLDRWIEPSGKPAEPIVARVGDDEVCSTTPSSEFQPYASEYEGYMGNYGNTMDRWYRRAALVLWPLERAFAVRAEASPAWALEVLGKRIRAGEVTEAREMASEVLGFWDTVARDHEAPRVLTKALRVSHDLDEAELAASLLHPFRVEVLTPQQATAFVALIGHYGEGWARVLVSTWSGRGQLWTRSDQDRAKWLSSLPQLFDALLKADGPTGTWAARLLLEDSWEWLMAEIEARRQLAAPSLRDTALQALARPLLGFLEATAVVGASHYRDAAVSFLRADENEPLLPCLMQILRTAGKTVRPAIWGDAGLDALARQGALLLEAQLAVPPRADRDWSIAAPKSCRCKLCKTLGSFLADPTQQRLEWPLAKDGRRHVHATIDTAELPVRHETRRQGRPYCLVLTKTNALFEREAATRRRMQTDAAWLARSRLLARTTGADRSATS